MAIIKGPDYTSAREDWEPPQREGEIPRDATIVERDANNNPTVYESGGERYYAPGSPMYESGFRTASEYREAQGKGASLGPHEGRLIPENTVVLEQGGQPVARFTEKQARKVDLESGSVKIPVKDKVFGTEKLLTLDQASRINSAATNEERFKLLQEYGVIPKSVSQERYASMASPEYKKIGRAEYKRDVAIGKLAAYKEKGGYNLTKVLAGTGRAKVNNTEKVLLAAGFAQADIDAAKAGVLYEKATPFGKFNLLKTRGMIPQSAKFMGIGEMGQVKYSLPASKKNPLNFVEYKGMVEPSATDTVSTTRPLSQADLESMRRQQETITAVAFGSIPVVGTAIYWGSMSPQWRAVSLATDFLVAMPIGSWLKGLKYFNKVPGMRAVDDVIRIGQRESRATLKATTTKAVVNAYDDMVKAGNQYAENLAEIAQLEKRGQTVLGGLRADEKLTLDLAKGQTQNLAEEVTSTGNKFASELSKAGATGEKVYTVSGRNNILQTMGRSGFDVTDQLKDFGNQYRLNIAQTVNKAYSAKVPNIKTVNFKIKTAEDALKWAVRDQDTAAITKNTNRLMELKQQLKIAQSGQIVKLTNARVANADKIAELESRIKGIRAATDASADEVRRTNNVIKALQNDLKAARQEAIKLQNQQEGAFKSLVIEYAEPIQLSSGRGGTAVKTPPRVGGGGGGVSTKQPRELFLAIPGAKLVYQDLDGKKEYQVPGVKVITIPGEKETIHVEPQPYWAGEVKTAEPEVKPWIVWPETKPGREPSPLERPPEYPKTTPFMPIPAQPETAPSKRPLPPGYVPGEITWTPSVVRSPKPGQETGIEFNAGTEKLTKSQVEASQKAFTTYMNQVASGISPNTAAKNVNKAYPGTMINPMNKTEQKTFTDLLSRAQVSTGSSIETKPQTKTKTQTQTSTTTTTTTTTETPPVPPVGRGGGKRGLTSREIISSSSGAIAWRQGQVGNKDVWPTVKYPYKSDSDGMIVVGGPPEGATIVRRGKGSARATAQMIKGKKKPDKAVNVDYGINDVRITPGSGRTITLDFSNDSKQLTKGDITIGRKTPAISRRVPRISGRTPRIR